MDEATEAGPVAGEFACAMCGAQAMSVRMTAADQPLDMSIGPNRERSTLRPRSAGIRTLAGTLDLWMAVAGSPDGGQAARDAIGEGDAATLFAIDPEIVPLYCPACDAAYCEAHWTSWPLYDPEQPSWFEELRGTCPKGHERRIHD
jgi:hypothetical protein